MAEIRVEKIGKNFGDFTAVRESSFTVNDGEFFVMLGPSGCGKTTTLRMIAGLEVPSTGRILLDGEDVTYNPGSKRDIAFVFQLFALYPHMTVRGNISFPLRVSGLSRKEVRAQTLEVAKMLQIDHILNSPVGGLSSGDRQRVALGRAIVRNAKAFLMDEPLGALDAEFRDLMTQELLSLHRRVKATTVYVTHDQIEAMAMADRICIMNHAEVLQIGSPSDVYLKPATKFVAGFIGSPSMNFLPVEGGFGAGLEQVNVLGGSVDVPKMHEGMDSAEGFLGARPEHIKLSDAGAVRGEVFGVEYMGARQLVTVKTDAGLLKVRADNTVSVRDGENVGLNFDRDSLIVFNAETDQAVSSTLFTEAGHG